METRIAKQKPVYTFQLQLNFVKISKHKYNDLLKGIRQLAALARHNGIKK